MCKRYSPKLKCCLQNFHSGNPYFSGSSWSSWKLDCDYDDYDSSSFLGSQLWKCCCSSFAGSSCWVYQQLCLGEYIRVVANQRSPLKSFQVVQRVKSQNHKMHQNRGYILKMLISIRNFCIILHVLFHLTPQTISIGTSIASILQSH